MFGTAAFGAPAFGWALSEYLGIDRDSGTTASLILSYFFGSAFAYVISGGMNEHYAKEYLDELKNQTSKVAINYNI